MLHQQTGTRAPQRMRRAVQGPTGHRSAWGEDALEREGARAPRRFRNSKDPQSPAGASTNTSTCTSPMSSPSSSFVQKPSRANRSERASASVAAATLRMRASNAAVLMKSPSSPTRVLPSASQHAHKTLPGVDDDELSDDMEKDELWLSPSLSSMTPPTLMSENIAGIMHSTR